jgi:phage terminase large subunit GpA-like protein
LFIVGVDGIKADIMSWLKIGQPGDGYCHFPKDEDGIPVRGYDAVYFEMLTAEKRVLVKNNKGFSVHEWHKAAGARNESFDCRVYARAALRIMSPKDDIMLKRIYTAEPWAGQAGEKGAVAPEGGKKKKPVVSRNKIARGKGIEL